MMLSHRTGVKLHRLWKYEAGYFDLNVQDMNKLVRFLNALPDCAIGFQKMDDIKVSEA